MPKSKVRKKTAYTPPPNRQPVKVKAAGPSHPVYKIVMFGLMLLGLLWLVVNYLAGHKLDFMAERCQRLIREALAGKKDGV